MVSIPAQVFSYPRMVLWGECDPAGLVYYPRFFEYFHDAMEAWFGAALRIPYKELIVDLRVGLPSVHVEADFRAPCHFGDELEVQLWVAKLGTSSLTLGYRINGKPNGDERLSGKTVCVFMDLDPSRATYRTAVPIPEEVRQRIEPFVQR